MKVLLCPFAGQNLKSEGPKKAPEAVKTSLENFFLSERGKYLDFEFEKLELSEDVSSNYEEIKKRAEEFSVAVGGDHSLTFPLFKSLKSKNEDMGLIVFDAHPDCQNDFYPPTYEDFTRTLLERDIVSKDHLILIGLRNWSRAEYEYLKEKGLNYFSMKEITRKGLSEVLEAVMYKAKEWNSVYLSIDIDVVDPAFAPGTYWREPGGMSSRAMITSIQKLSNLDIRFTDLMEINPDLDIKNRTARLGSKLLTCL